MAPENVHVIDLTNRPESKKRHFSLKDIEPPGLTIMIQSFRAMKDTHPFFIFARHFNQCMTEDYRRTDDQIWSAEELLTNVFKPCLLSACSKDQHRSSSDLKEVIQTWLGKIMMKDACDGRFYHVTNSNEFSNNGATPLITIEHDIIHALVDYAPFFSSFPSEICSYLTALLELAKGRNVKDIENTARAPSQEPNMCVLCGNEATSHCKGCFGALDSTPRMYCGGDCQRSDWEAHKKTCQLLKKRLMLQKACKILEMFFFTYREQCYEHKLTDVEQKESILFVTMIHNAWAKSQDFPVRAFEPLQSLKEFDKKAILAYEPIYLHDPISGPMLRLTRFCLQNLCTKIVEVEFWPRNMPRPVFVDAADGYSGNNMFDPHHILQVTLKTGEQFCVDITGAQYGLKEVVSPWRKYIKKHSVIIKGAHMIGHQAQVLANKRASGGPTMLEKLSDISHLVLERCFMDGLEAESIGRLQDLVNLNEASFNDKFGRLKNKLQVSFKAAMGAVETKITRE